MFGRWPKPYTHFKSEARQERWKGRERKGKGPVQQTGSFGKKSARKNVRISKQNGSSDSYPDMY